MLVFGRTPGRSAGFPGVSAGEAKFTIWLTGTIPTRREMERGYERQNQQQ